MQQQQEPNQPANQQSNQSKQSTNQQPNQSIVTIVNPLLGELSAKSSDKSSISSLLSTQPKQPYPIIIIPPPSSSDHKNHKQPKRSATLLDDNSMIKEPFKNTMKISVIPKSRLKSKLEKTPPLKQVKSLPFRPRRLNEIQQKFMAALNSNEDNDQDDDDDEDGREDLGNLDRLNRSPFKYMNDGQLFATFRPFHKMNLEFQPNTKLKDDDDGQDDQAEDEVEDLEDQLWLNEIVAAGGLIAKPLNLIDVSIEPKKSSIAAGVPRPILWPRKSEFGHDTRTSAEPLSTGLPPQMAPKIIVGNASAKDSCLTHEKSLNRSKLTKTSTTTATISGTFSRASTLTAIFEDNQRKSLKKQQIEKSVKHSYHHHHHQHQQWSSATASAPAATSATAEANVWPVSMPTALRNYQQWQNNVIAKFFQQRRPRLPPLWSSERSSGGHPKVKHQNDHYGAS